MFPEDAFIFKQAMVSQNKMTLMSSISDAITRDFWLMTLFLTNKPFTV